MTEPTKVVSTILYTEASEKVNREVAEELKVPDPSLEAAQAAIQEHQDAGKDKTSKTRE